MSADKNIDRVKLTFAQAEGTAPLPQQLEPKTLSAELRAILWHIVDSSMKQYVRLPSMYGDPPAYLRDPWKTMLQERHVYVEHQLGVFDNEFYPLRDRLRKRFEEGDYVEVLGFVEWLARHRLCPVPSRTFDAALQRSHAAYRFTDSGKTIVPIASDDEHATLERAFADLAATEFGGARAHLRSAAEHLTRGDNAGSIRESIHAVESIARSLSGENSLKDALRTMKATAGIHPALITGFLALYGFTNDEDGIRHALLDNDTADVDHVDALFMIGSCAAFV